MVARIKTPGSILRALNYNEQKLKQGRAELIHAANYLKDADQLNFSDKLKRFKDLIALNERAKTNSLHISLNFDNGDKLSRGKLAEIANEYMSKIGFGEQPYLVYQHHDAGHPHIHIVTTSIKENGKRIDTFNIGRNQSEKARQQLEQTYGLVKAKERQVRLQELKAVYAQKIQYGKSETRRAITNVLDAVLNNYKYTSLAELNAVLQQYNVIADRGTESSRIYKNNGVVYRVLDEKGNKIGMPIKSSIIYSKPGLKFLREKFKQNEIARQPDKLRIKNAIDLAFIKNENLKLFSLIKILQQQGIDTVLRQNGEGFIYGVTYVDHQTKSVFNGSDVGKQYSAKAILERCRMEQTNKQDDGVSKEIFKEESTELKRSSDEHIPLEKIGDSKMISSDILNDLLEPKEQHDYVPHQLKKSKRKKGKQISHRL